MYQCIRTNPILIGKYVSAWIYVSVYKNQSHCKQQRMQKLNVSWELNMHMYQWLTVSAYKYVYACTGVSKCVMYQNTKQNKND